MLADALLFVYAIDSIQSVHEIEHLLAKTCRLREVPDLRHVPCYLVGNKNDLQEGKVNEDELGSITRSYRLKHAQVSAKQNTRIDTVIEEVIFMALQKKVYLSKGSKEIYKEDKKTCSVM